MEGGNWSILLLSRLFQNTEYWRRSNSVLLYDWGGVRRKVGIGSDLQLTSGGCEGARTVIRLDQNSSPASQYPRSIVPVLVSLPSKYCQNTCCQHYNHQILIGNAGIARLQPIQWDSNHHLVVKECQEHLAVGMLDSIYAGVYWSILTKYSRV